MLFRSVLLQYIYWIRDDDDDILDWGVLFKYVLLFKKHLYFVWWEGKCIPAATEL